MVLKMNIKLESEGEQSPVFIQHRSNLAYPIRFRIGDPGSPGTRYTNLSPSQARQVAQFLIAAAQGG